MWMAMNLKRVRDKWIKRCRSEIYDNEQYICECMIPILCVEFPFLIVMIGKDTICLVMTQELYERDACKSSLTGNVYLTHMENGIKLLNAN